MRIAVDVMGGDYAPRETVAGCVMAAKDFSSLHGATQIVMVGREDDIRQELKLLGKDAEALVGDGKPLAILNATEAIEMDEHPAAAVRKKKDNSITRSIELVKEGKASAMVSAGNSGAVAAAALFTLGRIKGVSRPAIACILPTKAAKPTVIVDAGANMDCSPEWLVQFAAMGSVYSEKVIHRHEKPSVGLLSIGTEEGKGNELTKCAFRLLKESNLNFRGNVEGHDIFQGDTDVVVCDGFVGNAVLKTTESVARAIVSWMKSEFVRGPIRLLGAFCLKGALKSIKQRMDPELYGGAVLLGVPGVCIITHGASSRRAIYYAIRVASLAASNNIDGAIESAIADMSKEKGQQENAPVS